MLRKKGTVTTYRDSILSFRSATLGSELFRLSRPSVKLEGRVKFLKPFNPEVSICPGMEMLPKETVLRTLDAVSMKSLTTLAAASSASAIGPAAAWMSLFAYQVSWG